MFYEDVFREFAGSRVRYLIAGGIAVNLHGVPRMTYDLDILIDLVPDNIRLVFDALAKLRFRPKVPIGADDFADPCKRAGYIEKKGMRVLSFWQDSTPMREIDVFVENPIDFKTLWKRKAVSQLAGDLKVTVIGLNDLLYIKQLANRKQDVADIESLLVVKRINGEK
ncbi:MAG: DUF6036 family nucleotidyltransferase [Chlamydiota bacterium]